MDNEGQGGRYLEEENIFLSDEKKNREGKIFGEGKYISCGGEANSEKEKEENIWRRKYIFLRRRRKGKEII